MVSASLEVGLTSVSCRRRSLYDTLLVLQLELAYNSQVLQSVSYTEVTVLCQMGTKQGILPRMSTLSKLSPLWSPWKDEWNVHRSMEFTTPPSASLGPSPPALFQAQRHQGHPLEQ